MDGSSCPELQVAESLPRYPYCFVLAMLQEAILLLHTPAVLSFTSRHLLHRGAPDGMYNKSHLGKLLCIETDSSSFLRLVSCDSSLYAGRAQDPQLAVREY